MGAYFVPNRGTRSKDPDSYRESYLNDEQRRLGVKEAALPVQNLVPYALEW